MNVLSVRGLRTGYGDQEIVHALDLDLSAAEVAVIIGPNGAGKSTALKAIAGMAKVFGGQVLAGRDVTGQMPSTIASAGAAFVPQERNVFPSLTVAENLAIGGWLKRRDRRRRTEMLELFPELQPKLKTPAGLLSGGQRQMVAVAMALMVEPKLLLLDEPTAGLSPALVEGMLALVKRLAVEAGVAALIVEQNAQQALRAADRGYILVDGVLVRSSQAAELLSDPGTGVLFLGEAA
mgnify:CR=1 FL=1